MSPPPARPQAGATDDDEIGVYSQDELVVLGFCDLSICDYCTGTRSGFECLSVFTYWPGAGLNFHAISLEEHPGSYMATGAFIGQYYQHVFATPDMQIIIDLSWTPQTSLYLDTSPVPEPGAWATLGSRLGGLLAAQRRRPG